MLYCTNITFRKNFLLIFVSRIVFPPVLLSAYHLKRDIVFLVLLVFYILFLLPISVLLVFLHAYITVEFSLIFNMFVCRNNGYNFESAQGAMQQSKKQYTLHYIQQHTHNIILITQCSSIYINNNLFLISRYECYNFNNLFRSYLFLQIIYALPKNFMFLISTRTFCFRYPVLLTYLWHIVDVTWGIL